MEFSAKLKKLMKQQRYSQTDVAVQVEVSQSLVSLWTKGERVPDLRVSAKLARLFGVDLDYLADDAQDEPPASEFTEWERAVIDLIHALGLEKSEALRRLATPAAAGISVDPKPFPPAGPSIPSGAPAYQPERPRKKQPG
ncbi:helix-turn-helix domain-containing protein [Singulisphaera acidiphila]|nr:helix-turn-helix transcriptional regulator [Singulisphaera acidiphila]